MSLLKNAGKVVTVLKDDGLLTLFSILLTKTGLPFLQTAKIKWNAGVRAEKLFWNRYFSTKGLEWADIYDLSFDPDLPLQPRPAALLPDQAEYKVLDVGAGPLTYLGKKHAGKKLDLTAIDPLAEEYDKILHKHNITPVVRTEKLAAEEIRQRFAPDTFDLVFARNCIDHSFNPEQAILQMIEVVKSGRYVLLEHHPNEAEIEHYSGFHQWNFSSSADGDFLIGSKNFEVNMTRRYADKCLITCEVVDEGKYGEYLVTRIQKR